MLLGLLAVYGLLYCCMVGVLCVGLFKFIYSGGIVGVLLGVLLFLGRVDIWGCVGGFLLGLLVGVWVVII